MFQMGGIGPMMGQAHVFYRYWAEKLPAVIARCQNETQRLFGVSHGKRRETWRRSAVLLTFLITALWPAGILGSRPYQNGRNGEASGRSRTADMVKVFGCRQAYENHPCTNPRGCGDGLWGFPVLLGCGDGETGSAREPAGAW
jgi:hypothetical protein